MTSLAGFRRRKVFLNPSNAPHGMVSIPVRVNRKVKAGKHAILDVFAGLDRSDAFRALFEDGLREEVLRDCKIDVVPEDMYMHILRL